MWAWWDRGGGACDGGLGGGRSGGGRPRSWTGMARSWRLIGCAGRALGGRGSSEREPGLSEALDALIDPVTRGDPESPLRWTSKSAVKLAEALREMGHEVVDRTVLRLLKPKGYSLQGEPQDPGGSTQHPDRDAPDFSTSTRQSLRRSGRASPRSRSIPRSARLVGDFKAVGREFEPSGRPVEVRTHDFKDKDLRHAIPFGIYDLRNDEGWVNVGIDGNTAEFAVNSIIGWWQGSSAASATQTPSA